MSPLSYKASRNAESLRHSAKEYKKETKISCPASLKQNAGFIYADNPDGGENILKTFGLLYRSVSVKKVMATFFYMVLP